MYKKIKLLSIILLVLLIPLLQTYSLWYFQGEKVDESELIHYAVGFFGGDLDPHWYGYGNLGMYFLSLVYLILAIPNLLLGQFESLDQYSSQIFYNGYFTIVSRYTFAVIGLLTVLVYSKIAQKFKIPKGIIFSYILISIFSYDALFYANYLRTDRFVGLFVALSLLFALNSKDNKKYLYLLCVSVAAAISLKISALPLVIFLGVYVVYRTYDRAIDKKDYLGLIIVFLGSLFVFQPYMDWMGTLGSLLSDNRFSWSKPMYSTMGERVGAITQIFIRFCSLPVLLSLGTLIFSKAYKRIVLSSLLMLFLLILPYVTSSEITEYWFLPSFDLVRFLSALALSSIYGVIQKILEYNHHKRHLVTVVGSILITGLSIYTIKPNIEFLQSQYKPYSSNRNSAEIWLKDSVLGRKPILLDTHYNYMLPRVYDLNNIKESKRISRVFIYNRDKNEYLNRLFEAYLRNEYIVNSSSHQTTLSSYRLDFVNTEGSRENPQKITIKDPVLIDDNNMIKVIENLKRSKDIKDLKINGSEIEFFITGKDPYLVFDNLDIDLRNTYKLQFEIMDYYSDEIELFLSFSKPFNSSLSKKFNVTKDIVTMPLNFVKPKFELVKLISASEYRNENFKDKLNGAYFVTSPSIYNRFLKKPEEGLTEKQKNELYLYKNYYSYMISNKLVFSFKDKSGPVIEIYDLSSAKE